VDWLSAFSNAAGINMIHAFTALQTFQYFCFLVLVFWAHRHLEVVPDTGRVQDRELD
jgi:hypothetical protein